MSNNKYIVLPGGKECNLVNPYEKPMFTGGAPKSAWHQFEQTNPVYTLTEVMPEGEMFTGEPIDQHLFYEQQGWIDGTHQNANQTRIAIKPLKAIEFVKTSGTFKGKIPLISNNDIPKPPTDSSSLPPTDAVENKEERVELNIYVERQVKKEISEREMYLLKEGASIGANWQQSQSIEGIVGLLMPPICARLPNVKN